MPFGLRALAAFALSALALAGRAADRRPAEGGAAAARSADVVRLRFDWPPAFEAAATQRRTRVRTGWPAATTTTRFTQRMARRGGGLVIASSRTTWRGDAPYPGARDAVDALVRASEGIVQVVSPEGELVRVEGVEALRPAMERLLASAEMPPDQRGRALDAAEAAVRAQAREAWNLAVGFWTGADLELGETYVMKTDAEVPLLPGAKAEYDQEFSVRRRVPCTVAERALRCVEITLRATTDPAALPDIAKALVARLAGSDARWQGAIRELAVENELVLVTEPATLLPHRVVWTRTVRATGADGPDGAAQVLEQVDRSESEYRYAAPARNPSRRASRAR